MPWMLAICAAFAAGSIPFGLLLAKSRGLDIRQHGSRNIGATNVGRVLGRTWGLVCFVLDALKGAIPVAIAGISHQLWGAPLTAIAATDQWLWLATAMAALLGHMYSPWVGFRGGKGVATGFGALCAMWPAVTAAALAALVVWIAAVALSRYVSLASMLAAATIPIVVAASASLGSSEERPGLRAVLPTLATTAGLAGLVIWKHRANIARLLRGEEPQVGRGSNAARPR